jgi:hypothetical protein
VERNAAFLFLVRRPRLPSFPFHEGDLLADAVPFPTFKPTHFKLHAYSAITRFADFINNVLNNREAEISHARIEFYHESRIERIILLHVCADYLLAAI